MDVGRGGQGAVVGRSKADTRVSCVDASPPQREKKFGREQVRLEKVRISNLAKLFSFFKDSYECFSFFPTI